MTQQIDATVFHNASVRVPQLKAGESYMMKTWQKKACSYKQVTFLNWQRDGVAQHGVKVPQLNRIKSNEHLVFVADDEMFVGVQKDMALVREDNGLRITFAQLSVVAQEETLEELLTWLHANTPVQVEAVVGDEQYSVDEDKAARKRRLDAERKREKRAAERAAKDEAQVPDIQANMKATLAQVALVGELSDAGRRSAWA